MTRNQPRVEAVPGRFSPLSGTVCGLFAAVAMALFGDVVDGFQSWFPLVFAVAVSGAVWLARLKLKVRAITAWFTTGAITVPAVWAWSTIEFGWNPAACILLAGAAVFAAVFASLFQEKPATAAAVVAAEQEQAELGSRDPQEVEIEQLIVEFLGNNRKKRVAVTKVNEWPGSTGNTWLLEGARGTGFNYRWVSDIQVELAAAMRLPPGCPVNAAPAAIHQGAALLHVSRVNDMDKDIPFPTDYRVRSIRDDFGIAKFLDKTTTEINLFQDSTLVNGQKGSGKTVLLQGMTAHSLQCGDALTGHVDLNGGGISSAWMMLYAMGVIDESVLRWMAPTASTAMELAAYLLEVAKARKSLYQRMMVIHDEDVLPVGNGRDTCSVCHMIHPPAIQIFVDEAGEMMGDDAVKESQEAAAAFREVLRIARAMAINVTFSTQRGTSDYLPAQVKKAISQMITLRVADESELSWLFGWKKGLSPEDLIHQGQGYIQRRGGAVRMFKTYRLMPAQITDITRFVASQPRPQLEQKAVDLGGDWLDNFWRHPDILEFLDRLRGDGNTAAMGQPAAVPQFQPAGRERITGSALSQALSTVPPPAPTPPAPATRKDPLKMDEVAVTAEFEAIMSGQGFGTPETGPAEPAPPVQAVAEPVEQLSTKTARQNFIADLVAAAGATGIKTEDVIRQALAAGHVREERPQLAKETLTDLQKDGRVAKKLDDRGQEIKGWWVGPGYAAR